MSADARALEIIESLISDDPCDLDHNQNCQAHFHFTWDGSLCHMEVAKRFLAEQRKEETMSTTDEMRQPKRAVPTRLILKPVVHIITFWHPGSRDYSWTWADEYDELIDDSVTEAIRARVKAEGFGFADDSEPVMLGNDGRVWDGHHRICLAIEQAAPHLLCEVVEPMKGLI